MWRDQGCGEAMMKYVLQTHTKTHTPTHRLLRSCTHTHTHTHMHTRTHTHTHTHTTSTPPTSKASKSCSLAVGTHSSPQTKEPIFFQYSPEGMDYSSIPANQRDISTHSPYGQLQICSNAQQSTAEYLCVIILFASMAMTSFGVCLFVDTKISKPHQVLTTCTRCVLEQV